MNVSYTPQPSTQRALIRDSYILHIRAVTCTSCRSTTHTQELFEVWLCTGKADTRTLRPFKSETFNKDLPVGYSNLQATFIPVCRSCVQQVRSSVRYDSEAAWRATLARKAEEEAARAALIKAAEKKPHLHPILTNDLDSL